MQQKASQPDVKHLLALGSFRNWLRLARANEIDRPFLSRALFVTLASLSTAPLRAYEHMRYDRAVKNVQLNEPPIFILGHWRSGTTNLHYLMSQDARMGYITMFQMVAPEMLFVGERVLKPAFAKVTPTTRPVDNLPLSVDGAQEEEFGLATMSPHSFYHYWFFPRRLEHYLNTYALFKDAPAPVVAEWKALYLAMLRKATLHMGGKRLLIKNPTNTGRIKQLLELFPDAKFVHIVRDPYRVFLSMRYMATKSHEASQLQTITPAEIEANVLHIYQAVMQQYLRDRALIPAQNLVEVRFEDIEVDPLHEIRRIYDHLGLTGYAEAEPGFLAYINSLGDFKKNPLKLSDQDIANVNAHWDFAFNAWGYPRRTPNALPQPHAATPDGLLAAAVAG